MSSSTAVLLGATACVHLALPLLLRLLARNKRAGGLCSWGRAQYLYDSFTFALALVAVCIGSRVLGTVESMWGPRPILGGVVGLLIGGLLPFLIAALRGRRLMFSSGLHETKLSLQWLIMSATGEEIIWRWVAVQACISLGFSNITSYFIASVGFIVVHIVSFGMRSVPYISIFTICVALVAMDGGLPAAIIMHVMHNLVISRTVSSHVVVRNEVVPPRTSEW